MEFINNDSFDLFAPEFHDIVNAIANRYEFIEYASVPDKTLTTVKIGNTLKSIMEGAPDKSPLAAFADCILDDFKERYTYFLNMERICTVLNNRKNSDTFDLQYISDDGSVMWMRIKFLALSFKDDKLESYLVTLNDITEEKVAEQKTFEALHIAFDSAKRANSAMIEFLSRMSHDIRTPMNAIMGMTAIATTCLDDKEHLSKCLDKINVSSKHLMNLLNEILDMSRIESGRMILAEENLNIYVLTDNITAMINSQLSAKSQKLDVNFSNILHPDLIGDRMRMQQCFLNFLTNSIKYTPEGGHISLSISERPCDIPDFALYEFIFEDDGYGMDPDFVEHIFEPFTREEDSRTSKIQGTGLGMTIAYNIVSLMEGHIDVWSKRDEGSRFTVTVNLKIQSSTHDDVTENESHIMSPSSYDFSGKRILLVEDNEMNLEIAQEILEMTGAEVDTAENGKIALDKVNDSNPGYYDIIIMDIQMPVMNGYDAAIAIRSLDRSDTKALPIIAMTANAFAEDVDLARNSGMQEHVAKPLNVEELFSAIQKWI